MFKILIAFNLIALISALSCSVHLRHPGWTRKWHLLVIRDLNNRYQLLRTNTVPANSDLLMFCNKEPRIITARCQANGKFDRELPPTRREEQCNEADSLHPIKLKAKVSYCPYDLYTIGYNIEVDKVSHFLEAYEVCFDQQHMRTLFAINEVYPTVDYGPGFPETNNNEVFYGTNFDAFKRFNRMLVNKQPDMNRKNYGNIVIGRGQMAPSGDFITTNLKRASFDLINLMPQFKTINQGNWFNIEAWTNMRAHAGGRICTGVLDCNLNSRSLSDLHCVLQLKDKDNKIEPMFIANDHKIPVPLWKYKILKQQSVVFLTLNNIYHNGDVPKPVEFCSVIECPKTIHLGVTRLHGTTFCCRYNEFISKSVPYLRNVC